MLRGEDKGRRRRRDARHDDETTHRVDVHRAVASEPDGRAGLVWAAGGFSRARLIPSARGGGRGGARGARLRRGGPRGAGSGGGARRRARRRRRRRRGRASSGLGGRSTRAILSLARWATTDPNRRGCRRGWRATVAARLVATTPAAAAAAEAELPVAAASRRRVEAAAKAAETAVETTAEAAAIARGEGGGGGSEGEGGTTREERGARRSGVGRRRRSEARIAGLEPSKPNATDEHTRRNGSEAELVEAEAEAK